MTGQQKAVVGTTAEETFRRTNQGKDTKKTAPVLDYAVFQGEKILPETTSETSPPTLAEILQAAKIHLSAEYEIPPKAISIVDGESVSVFGTLGNFSLVKGKAKSKKTFLMCLVLAACIDTAILQGKIKSDLPDNKRRIILFDTEQSKYHVWKRLQAVSRLATNANLDNIEVYSLREFEPKKRCELIEYALTEGNPGNDIGLAVVDGIRDLINDINDPKEGTLIATKLMQWTTVSWCHIITVLHENKADNNPRGHVGTELLNKAETVISVTATKDDKAVSIVEAEMTRDKDFPAFAFRITESGTPEIIEDFEVKGTGEKKTSFDPYSIQPDIHQDILKKVFKTSPEQKRGEFRPALKTAWGAYSQKIGDNKADELIAYYSQMGWVKNLEEVKGRAARYVLSC